MTAKTQKVLGIVLITALLAGCRGQAAPPAAPPPAGETATLTMAAEESTTAPSATAAETATETATATASSTPTQTLVATIEQVQGPVRGIILLIGDGMGVGQRQAGQWLAYGQEGLLAMDNMPVLGFQETGTYGGAITDSAAAATALASGIKTHYGTVGMDTNYEAVPTILEMAQSAGWSVGLVTTVMLSHATPACFAAHTEGRSNMLTIAGQMADHDIDVLLGGGEDDFIPSGESGCHPNRGHRWDDRNLVQEEAAEGAVVVCTGEELAALDLTTVNRLVGFFADDEMRAPYSPTLAEMTTAAIEVLSHNPNGFFLMVEGGQIDWEAHDLHSLEMMQLVIGFDAAVAVAQVYALGEPNTLVIVTGDHETGGVSVNLDDSGSYLSEGPYAMPDGTAFWVDWEGGHHTGANIPVTAQGPWSELLYGEYPNTWIFRVMLAALRGSLE